ncbi:MAG: FecR domain-containing protein [Polyangiaceae bacterium]|nr:FecR domain-containing protein [Polyangiaceae bacterium]
MSRLRLPVGDALRDGFDEVDVQRVWRGIHGHAAAASDRRRAWRWGAPGVALAAAALILLLVLVPRGNAPVRPLELSDGGLPATLAAAAGEPERTVELSDGSRIVLGAGASLDVLSNEAGSFLTALRHGHTRFDVRPERDRRWVIECGIATVEVVGTAFSIDRGPDRVEVAVERGTVIVRGDRVPDQVQRLSTGERLVVTRPKPAVAGGPASAPERAASPSAGQPASAPSSTATPPTPSPTSAQAPIRIDDLVRRADAARAAGDVALATELLERVVNETSADDPRRALAALTLARLNMAQSPERASRALSSALASTPPGLEEDVLARLVEARARAGDREGARQAAQRYERRFPSGARLAEVRRWIAE